MSMASIPRGAPDAAMVYIADHAPDRCGHGRTWDQECPACASVWREERVKDLHKQAAKYGFKLVPLD
jgi:hypothetical protein